MATDQIVATIDGFAGLVTAQCGLLIALEQIAEVILDECSEREVQMLAAAVRQLNDASELLMLELGVTIDDLVGRTLDNDG